MSGARSAAHEVKMAAANAAAATGHVIAAPVKCVTGSCGAHGGGRPMHSHHRGRPL